MNLSSILARHIPVLALAVILLTAATVLAEDAPVNPTLIIQPGTILTVRPNEQVSSDLNRPGDVFSGSLAQPVIVRGIVVAQRGQTVAGRVVEAKKAGIVSGTSRLGVTLTSLTLVDGQSVPISSHLVVRNGESSPERDAAAIAGTTGFGAAIGATADYWGEGAAIGAGAGAAAGTIGVLLTRGHSTVIHPEMLLSFQVTQPVTIHTEDAPQAFRSVVAGDYPQESTQTEEAAQAPPPPPPPPPPAYPRVYYYPPPYYYPYPYFPYYGYPYFYGPSFTFFFGSPGYYPYPRYYGYSGYRGYYGYPRFYGYRPYYGRGYGPRAVPRYPHFHAQGRPHR